MIDFREKTSGNMGIFCVPAVLLTNIGIIDEKVDDIQ